MLRRQLLAAAILSCLTAASAAQAQANRDSAPTDPQLEVVTVTADPLARQGEESYQPVDVLAGAKLDEARANTIGETVAGLPGVQSSYFGPGVGRPIIRGLDGPRVQVLSGGISSLDVSTVSVDHAVAVDPFLADQVEILKGPSSLLFGAGAIGGVVNVVDGRVPARSIEGITGRAELRATDVNDEKAGAARVDAGNGTIALHADYARRYGDDYDAPDDGVLDNTQTSTTSRSVGIGLTGDAGHLGVAISAFDNSYGIPPEIEDEEPSVPVAIRGPKAEEGPIELRIDQQRIDFEAALVEPLSGVESISARVGRNDYEHVEVLLDSGEVGTRFLNEATEGRLELVHAILAGWRGAFGLQASRREFEAIGDEAFVPPSDTDDFGLFIVERATFGALGIELGARFDQQEIDADEGDRIEHDALSLSAAARWDFSQNWHASLNLDRARRAPGAEELLSDGPHEATGSFEVGDVDLSEETSNQVELGLHWHGDGVRALVAAYYNRFDDYIFLVDTDLVEDDLPVRLWTQSDATFRGIEGEIEGRLADAAWGRLDGRVFGDSVRGELRDGGNLPRISPARLGAGLTWTRDAWRAGVDAVRYAEQDRTAPLEESTPGFTLVNADLSWGFEIAGAEWELFAKGRNLTDRAATIHTSLLRDRAPLPGRSLGLGIRVYF